MSSKSPSQRWLELASAKARKDGGSTSATTESPTQTSGCGDHSDVATSYPDGAGTADFGHLPQPAAQATFTNSGSISAGVLLQGSHHSLTVDSLSISGMTSQGGSGRDRMDTTVRGEQPPASTATRHSDTRSPQAAVRDGEPSLTPEQCVQQQLQDSNVPHRPHSDHLLAESDMQSSSLLGTQESDLALGGSSEKDAIPRRSGYHGDYSSHIKDGGDVENRALSHHYHHQSVTSADGFGRYATERHRPGEDLEVPDEGSSVDQVRVFIAHGVPQSPHDCSEQEEILRSKIVELSDYLRDNGLDARLDQYCMDTGEVSNWPMWYEQQFAESAYILVVCTEPLFRRPADGSGGDSETQTSNAVTSPSPSSEAGSHASIQARLVFNSVAQSASKLLPILVDDEPPSCVPTLLHGMSTYRLRFPLEESDGEDLVRMYARLTSQNTCSPAPLGRRKVLRQLSSEV